MAPFLTSTSTEYCLSMCRISPSRAREATQPASLITSRRYNWSHNMSKASNYNHNHNHNDVGDDDENDKNTIETPYYAAVAAPIDGRSVRSEYLFLPEAQDLFWNDDFFDGDGGGDGGDEDVIAVFDFDYDQMTLFETQTKAAGQVVALTCAMLYAMLLLGVGGDGGGGEFFFAPLVVIGLYLVTLAPCFLRLQVLWQVESNHLAITRDGIRYVQDKRKSCWGLSMCDKGKSSKTVPFDKITDCDIIEPAGNAYLCFPRILYTVNVDTASSGGEGHRHELKITGLKEPLRFKKLVWAMKRAAGSYSYQAPSSTSSSNTTSIQPAPAVVQNQLEMVDQLTNKSRSTTSSNSSGDVAGLLKDIREELRQNNELLRRMQQNNNDPKNQPSSSAAAAAAIEEGSLV